MAKKEESVRWVEMERALAALKKSELIDLVHDLFELSAETRNFLGARLARRKRRSAAIEPYRAIVVERFFPASGGPGDLDLARAYKAITDYRKATGNKVCPPPQADGPAVSRRGYVGTGRRYGRTAVLLGSGFRG